MAKLDTTSQPLPGYVSQLRCGLSWDAQPETELDLDLAVLSLTETGQLAQGKAGLIYAGHPCHPSGSIKLLNDSLTGQEEGDDEQLLINLLTLPEEITRLIFIVNIDCAEAQQQDFSQTANAFWRLLDGQSNKVLLSCDLFNPQWQGITTLLVATLDYFEHHWQLSSVLEPSPFQNLHALLQHYL